MRSRCIGSETRRIRIIGALVEDFAESPSFVPKRRKCRGKTNTGGGQIREGAGDHREVATGEIGSDLDAFFHIAVWLLLYPRCVIFDHSAEIAEVQSREIGHG